MDVVCPCPVRTCCRSLRCSTPGLVCTLHTSTAVLACVDLLWADALPCFILRLWGWRDWVVSRDDTCGHSESYHSLPPAFCWACRPEFGSSPSAPFWLGVSLLALSSQAALLRSPLAISVKGFTSFAFINSHCSPFHSCTCLVSCFSRSRF